MTSSPTELYEKFFEIAARGDEAAAREFLLSNIKQFPQDIQDSIVVAFIEEALEKKNSNDATLSDLRKEGFAATEAMLKAKHELAKKEKLEGLKKEI
jgi:hypothetical protein